MVGDFVENYKQDLPSELAILLLFDPRTGVPKAMLDASEITDMRTGAVTAIGAKYLARKNSKTLAHVGARGTAYWNVRLLDRLFDFEEIRVHSLRPESRESFAERLSRDLNKRVMATGVSPRFPLRRRGARHRWHRGGDSGESGEGGSQALRARGSFATAGGDGAMIH